MSSRVAVVIPYFQREPGLLLKALRSVFNQEGDPDLDIIVVDDSSPIAAADELAKLPPHEAARVRSVRQANAGPAGARNTALDLVAAGTEYVAFLDSDDEWTPNHLANALRALDAGYDFYFSDFRQPDQTVGAFGRAGRLDPARHERLFADAPLHRYQGDMQDQVLLGNVIGTPTVVYRYAAVPGLRFRSEYFFAGEDYLFWLDLSALTQRICFSAAIECICGRGVNIFAGSGWGTEHSLIRLHHEMKYRKAVPRLFKLTPQQAEANRKVVRGLRKSFVADVLHRLRHRKPWRDVAVKQVQVDARSGLYFLPLAFSVLLGR